MDEQVIKFSLKQLYAGITAALVAAGSVFSAGVWSRNEACKVAISKAEEQQQKDIRVLRNTLESELLSAQSDRDFFAREYRKANNRLDICLKQGEYTEVLPVEKSN
jgi:hypothetical protein